MNPGITGNPTVAAPTDPQAELFRYIRNDMAIQDMQDFQEERALQRDERLVNRVKLQSQLREARGETAPRGVKSPLEMMADPNWLAQFKEMDPEDKDLLLTAMSSTGGGGNNNLLALMLYA